MNAYFTEEHESFRKSLKDFLQKEVVPHIEKWENGSYNVLNLGFILCSYAFQMFLYILYDHNNWRKFILKSKITNTSTQYYRRFL